jgi:hypothetical protein
MGLRGLAEAMFDWWKRGRRLLVIQRRQPTFQATRFMFVLRDHCEDYI